MKTTSGSGDHPEGSLQPPVFVFPAKLDFYLKDASTHKQAISIYNPYHVDIKYKILCNKPSKYYVVEPEGTIVTEKCSDVVVRHVAVSAENVQEKDKFRIHLFDTSDLLLSKKDILATLHPGFPDPSSDGNHSHSLPHRMAHPSSSSPINKNANDDPSGDLDALNRLHPQPQPSLVACFAAVVCIFALSLPTEGDVGESSLFQDYPWLHLTVTQKLVFAYVLGLVTMNILRTT